MFDVFSPLLFDWANLGKRRIENGRLQKTGKAWANNDTKVIWLAEHWHKFDWEGDSGTFYWWDEP